MLALKGYTLSIGQCRALAKVFETANPHYIKTLVLENCGVDDGENAVMLEGLTNQKSFGTFFYKQNVFAAESLESMKKLLMRPKP